MRPLTNLTKQMAQTYTWGWTQQLHLVVNLTGLNAFQAQPMNGP